MRTVAETFLDVRDGLSRSRGSRSASTLDPLLLCDRTRDAYLALGDLPASDGVFAPQLFASLRALVAPRTGSDIFHRAASRAHVLPHDHGPASTITAILVVLTAVLVGSIAIGTLTLSIVLAGALGLAGYFAAGGSVFGFEPWRRVREPRAPIVEDVQPAERIPDVDRLEAALRQTDVLLAQLRDVRQIEPPSAAKTLTDDRFLAFLQDLAEAGSEGDGDHLTKLTRRRLPGVMETLGLRFSDLDDESQPFFAIDQINDAARRGTAVTVRPAITRDGRCLARGYARRYV